MFCCVNPQGFFFFSPPDPDGVCVVLSSASVSVISSCHAALASHSNLTVPQCHFTPADGAVCGKAVAARSLVSFFGFLFVFFHLDHCGGAAAAVHFIYCGHSGGGAG